MKYWDEKSMKLLAKEELKKTPRETPVDDKEASGEKKAVKSKK